MQRKRSRSTLAIARNTIWAHIVKAPLIFATRSHAKTEPRATQYWEITNVNAHHNSLAKTATFDWEFVKPRNHVETAEPAGLWKKRALKAKNMNVSAKVATLDQYAS